MMKIKRYFEFLESFGIQMVDITESLSIWKDTIIDVIGAVELNIREELNIGDELKLDSLDNLVKNRFFFNSLNSIKLKCSSVETIGVEGTGAVGDGYQTFLKVPFKYALLSDFRANELESPKYILVQSWIENMSRWEDIKLYRIDGDFNEFYEKLTSRTIELTEDSSKYIYTTSNGGNDWNLESGKVSDTFKKVMRKEEIQNLINNGISVSVI